MRDRAQPPRKAPEPATSVRDRGLSQSSLNLFVRTVLVGVASSTFSKEYVMNGSERRGGSRRRVLKKALIVFNDGHCSMGCQVLDTTDRGALLLPLDTLLCPKEFVLKPSYGQKLVTA